MYHLIIWFNVNEIDRASDNEPQEEAIYNFPFIRYVYVCVHCKRIHIGIFNQSFQSNFIAGM